MAFVLIVDDSELDRRLSGGILTKRGGWTLEYAANGAEALQRMSQIPPDVVLTDLHMPEMDGLTLVSKIRHKYPLVPVVLMTARGSEETAVRALQQGAASYVSKARIAQELPDVLEGVLAVAKADRHSDRLLSCLVRTEKYFVLENDPVLLYPLVDHLQQLVTRLQMCDDTGRIQIGIALEEALLNALLHGNLELSTEMIREAGPNRVGLADSPVVEQRCAQPPYADRRIHVFVKITPQDATFVVRDEGPGFDPAQVPDPTDLGRLDRDHGRGLLLMRTFMDEVRYNAQGNEVTLVKSRDASQRRIPSPISA